MKKKERTPPPVSPAPLIDTHCHLDMAVYQQDLVDVLQRATDTGVLQTITIGIDCQSSQQAVKLAKHHPQLFATIGIHPHDLEAAPRDCYKMLADLYQSSLEEVVGWGEIGLDYVKQYSPPELQRTHFRRQLQIAAELSLPVIIHSRGAEEDTYAILKECGPYPNGGIMHCFAGDLEYANKIIELGLMLSIPGIVTYKTATTLHQVAREVSLHHLVLETDGPYLSPEPYRGKRNEPAFTVFTAQRVAELKGISLAEVASVTTQNAKNLFNLPDIKQ